MKGDGARTRILLKQVLDYEGLRAKVCQVWKNEPHDTKSLAQGKNPNKKGQKKSKKSDSSGKKKTDKKGKGKEKAPASANILTVPEIAVLDTQTAQSIDFSCYEMSEKVEWCLDSGCTDHITPSKSDFVQYWALGQASKAEIANGKYLKIEGYGTVIGYSIMQNKTVSLQIQNVLYVPEANKRLFSLIAAGQ